MSRFLRRGAVASALAFFVVPVAASAQQFEGVISMRLTGSGPQARIPTDAEYYASRSGKARLDLVTQMGKAAIIVAPADGKMFMLLDQMSGYVEQDLGTMLDPNAQTNLPKIVRTGKKETIAGYECEHLTIDALDVCATTGLGAYLNVGGNIMARGGVQPWQSAMLKENLFPLKVTTPEGVVQLLVTKIEKKAVDPAVFRVPANYSKIALPGRGG